jgi:hypothetical protein
MVVIEIVGGRLTLRSRVDGDADALAAETERLVYEKAEQLDEIIRDLITDEPALTGFESPEGRRYYPMLVNIGAYPVNPITMSVIEDRIRDKQLFDDSRIARFSIIDIGELEMVEGLSQTGGMTLPQALKSWHSSDLSRISLRNHMFAVLPEATRSTYRSQALLDAWAAVDDEFVSVLAPSSANAEGT